MYERIEYESACDDYYSETLTFIHRAFLSLSNRRRWQTWQHVVNSIVRFLWAKGLESKNIYKEMLLVYGKKCLSRKAVYNKMDKFSIFRNFQTANNLEMTTMWSDSNPKNFYAAGIEAVIKRWDKCINVAGDYVKK